MQINTRRMVWRCRRGLLELDLLLSRFDEQDFLDMPQCQLDMLDKLLDYPDNELLDLVTGRIETEEPETLVLLDKIRNKQAITGSNLRGRSLT